MGDASPKFDHVVVLMFENRSFDNVLGRLYEPGEVPQFEGVLGRTLANPIPADVNPGGPRSIPVRPADNMDTPDPDPGEEYPHVNTQLFGTVAPPDNRFCRVDAMEPPFNAPDGPTTPPAMDGFVADYANTFQVEMGRAPTLEQLAQVMAGYTREQLPVLTSLARGFACFDHWFCEVPTQTYANRSFFHAASSSGLVDNDPPGSFATLNDAPTIFERLEAQHRTWKVYIDPSQILPATALIHARRLAPYFATHFSTLFDFYGEARTGALPDYAFLEPNMLHPHTDMHPPGAARLREALDLPPPQSMAGGEQLLARVYESVRDSASPAGSNWRNTLFLVTFDEHGGLFDHVPPPPAPPPGDVERAQCGFKFDRSGVRIPAIVVSAWVDAGTVVTDEHRSTSLIRTLRERWALGPPLTKRDEVAPDLAACLTRSEPRPPSEWPKVSPRPLGWAARVVEALDHPLARIEKDLVAEALALEAGGAAPSPPVDVGRMARREAVRHLSRVQARWFPGLVRGRTA